MTKTWTAPVVTTGPALWEYDHSAHVRTFRAAPLSMRRAWVKSEIAKIDAHGPYDHPESYYSDQDRRRKLAASLVGKTDREYDPMGVWFGRMSN